MLRGENSGNAVEIQFFFQRGKGGDVAIKREKLGSNREKVIRIRENEFANLPIPGINFAEVAAN